MNSASTASVCAADKVCMCASNASSALVISPMACAIRHERSPATGPRKVGVTLVTPGRSTRAAMRLPLCIGLATKGEAVAVVPPDDLEAARVVAGHATVMLDILREQSP